ncbi:MAG: Crp/Fnr family transcriptional regulator [Thermodesulfobacteriota bacterium]|nr:Crp/Fnr family transcriptional regulator [Thermodesulfobacteriota bacterium]
MKPEEFLKGVDLFHSLSAEDGERLARAVKRRSLKKGETLFRKGDEGNALYIVKSGRIRIVLPSDAGDEVSPAILSEGDFFGEMALLDGMPRSADAVALEPTELYALNRSDFLSFLTNNERAIQSIFSNLSMRLRRTDDLLEDICFFTTSTRLARRLVELARDYGSQKETTGIVQIDLRLTQRDLASMVGVTRESINKELRVLREKELIGTEGNAIQILDMIRLKRRARL